MHPRGHAGHRRPPLALRHLSAHWKVDPHVWSRCGHNQAVQSSSEMPPCVFVLSIHEISPAISRIPFGNGVRGSYPSFQIRALAINFCGVPSGLLRPVRVSQRILPYQQRLLRVHAFWRVRHCTNHDMPHVVVSRCRIRFTGQRKQCHATLKTCVDQQSIHSGECSCGEMASCKHKHWCGVPATNGCECSSNGVLRGGSFYLLPFALILRGPQDRVRVAYRSAVTVCY